jgi:hypothetical protein
MYATGDSWDGDHTESGIINDPLKEKTPAKVHWHGLELETPPPSGIKATPMPMTTDGGSCYYFGSTASLSHKYSMAATERPRLPESSLTPRAFGGSAAKIENAERWIRYLNQYIQYRNLRDEEALTLFKLLMTD